jgi:ABC-type multidrug transport system ATPase subunit
MVLGLSGTGKSATINSLLGRPQPVGYKETGKVRGCGAGVHVQCAVVHSVAARHSNVWCVLKQRAGCLPGLKVLSCKVHPMFVG